MATDIVKSDQINASFQGMTYLPVLRQLGLLVGLSASIALGVYIVLWTQTPSFSVLYHQVAARDAGEIISVLQGENIKYQVDTTSGVIMVDSSRLHKARMVLAAQSLPRSAGSGFELIEKEQGFGTSNFIQTARYQRALEGELANTIMAMSAIASARVHLALPKQSAFLSDRRKPSASVLVNLASGRKLADEQVSAIMHLVASSVPNMESDKVTLVDNKGHLLSKTENSVGVGLSSRQFEYKRQIESGYADNIVGILTPIVGGNKVHAQVVAEMDFTQIESTQESFNPDSPAVRSEQRIEEKMQGSMLQGGVPGALSNEPPGAAQAPEQTANIRQNVQAGTSPTKTKIRYTRNNELDRSIVHKRQSPGIVKRLSVAVVIDNKQVKNDKGEIVSTPYKADELTKFTALIKEAVGFSAIRGDSVNVINAEFSPLPEIGPVPEESFLDQPWVWDLARKIFGGLLALVVALLVLRPMMKNLATVPRSRATNAQGDGLDEDQLTLTGGQRPRLPKPNEYESDLEMAKAMTVQEPKRVAQVVKSWVNEGG